MVSLLELPNELIIAIGSHLRKPSDLLHFILVNRRAHRELTHLLYQTINLDYRDTDALSSTCHGDSFRYPFIPINLLSNRLKIKPQLGSNTRTLDIVLVEHTSRQQYGLTLLPYLPRLQHLSLSIRKVDDLPMTRTLSPSTLADSLNSVSGTLETLRLHADHNPAECDGSRIGSLRHYTLLERLTIQSHILLGEDMNSLSHLNAILPPALQGLRVGFVNGVDGIEDEGNVRVLAFSQKGDLICPLPANPPTEDSNALRERHRVTLILQKANPSQLIGPKTRHHAKELTMEVKTLC